MLLGAVSAIASQLHLGNEPLEERIEQRVLVITSSSGSALVH